MKRRVGADEAASLRAAPAEELGFHPASTKPETVDRHRRGAARAESDHAEYLSQYGPSGHRRNYRDAVEKKRQEAAEADGCAAVADLYE